MLVLDLVIALVGVLVIAVVFLAYKNCKTKANDLIEAYVECAKCLVSKELYNEVKDDVVHSYKTIKKALGQIVRGLWVTLRWLGYPIAIVFAPIVIILAILWAGFTK